MSALSDLLIVADAYCAATGLSRGRVATLVFNHGSKLDLIAAGRDLNTRSWEKAMAWFSANWPDGLDWPEGIDRPVVAPAPDHDAGRLAPADGEVAA